MSTIIESPAVDDTETPEPTLTVFSKNDCPDCNSTKGLLNRQGVPFVEINVEEDTAPRDEFGGLTPFDHVVATYGRRMPTVVLTKGTRKDFWGGVRMDKLMETIKIFREAGLLTK